MPGTVRLESLTTSPVMFAHTGQQRRDRLHGRMEIQRRNIVKIVETDVYRCTGGGRGRRC